MQFQQRSDVLVNWTATSWGSAIQVPIPREFFLEGLIISFKVSGYNATNYSMATPSFAGDFLAGICDNIRLDVPTGSTLRSPVNASSAALLHYFRLLNGGLDRRTIMATDRILNTASMWPAGSGAGAFREAYINIPIMFTPPNIDDPNASFFLLPLPRYSANPLLNIQVTNTGAAPAPFATGNGTSTVSPTLQYKITMLRRFVDAPSFPVYDTEFNFVRLPFPNAGDNQYNEIPAPGAFTSLMFMTYQADGKTVLPLVDENSWYSSTSGSGAIVQGTGFTQYNKYFELKFLGNTIRRMNPLEIQAVGDWSTDVCVNPTATVSQDAGTIGPHVFMWDFMSDRVGANAGDFGSVLDTTPLVGQGARVQLYASPTYSGTGGSVMYMYYHRVFGDISPFIRKFKPTANKG